MGKIIKFQNVISIVQTNFLMLNNYSILAQFTLINHYRAIISLRSIQIPTITLHSALWRSE